MYIQTLSHLKEKLELRGKEKCTKWEEKTSMAIFFPDCANYTAMPASKLVRLIQN